MGTCGVGHSLAGADGSSPLTRMRPLSDWSDWSMCRTTYTCSRVVARRWGARAGDSSGLPPALVGGGVGRRVHSEAIASIRRCEVYWRPHDVHRSRDVLFPELTAANAAALGRVVAARVTSSDASPQEEGVTNVAGHGSPTWTGAIYGTVPEAEVVGAKGS